MSQHLGHSGYPGIDESINLVGISGFIDAADGSMDVREIERSLVEQTEQKALKDVDEDVVAEFQKRIASMESGIGISLSAGSAGGAGGSWSPAVGVSGGTDADDGEEESDEDAGSGGGASTQPIVQQFGARVGGGWSGAAGGGGWSGAMRHSDPGLERMSLEQQRQHILQNALSNINTHEMTDGDTPFSLDVEKENDQKNLLLEQINMLRTNLEDDSIKISDVRVVSTENTLEEVERVFEQLRYRNDHARYCGFAKELAEVGAYGLEWAFDGKKNYFGVRPDLTGWGATLNIKMRRLRYETSRLVSDGMAAYNLGNFSRLCLELVPSMIIHSKMRANKIGASKTRPSDADVSSAIDKIRDKSVARKEHGD